MSHRKPVGFIKTFQHTNTTIERPDPQFSYFRMKNSPHDDQFSPYKSEQKVIYQKYQSFGPTIKYKVNNYLIQEKKEKPKKHNKQIKRFKSFDFNQKSSQKIKAQQLYQKIKSRITADKQQSFYHEQSLKNQQANEIREKIEKLDDEIFKMKSNISQRIHQKSQLARNKFYSQSSSDQKESYYQRKTHDLKQKDNIQTISEAKMSFTQGEKLQKKVFCIQDYTSSSEEIEGDSRAIIESRKQMVESKSNIRQNLLNMKDMVLKKGGVCFEVDTKQFEPFSPATRQDQKFHTKQKKKKDEKAILQRRRETAKMYDKLARKAVFNSYY